MGSSCNNRTTNSTLDVFQDEDNDKPMEYTLALVGDINVGKTSLMYRFTERHWSDNIAIMGVDQKKRDILLEHKPIRVVVRDTGGQEKYRTFTALHFRKAQGIILVYDITNERSFNSLSKWMTEIDQYALDAVKLVIGNKVDLKDSRMVQSKEAKEFAVSTGLLFYETSAKDGTGVDDAINELIKEIIKRNEVM